LLHLPCGNPLSPLLRFMFLELLHEHIVNKYIGDDTKAAALQSLNCIKNKNNETWRKTIFNMPDGILTPYNVAGSQHWFRQVTAPCSMACGSEIVTVNLPSGNTLQCDTWLWDDMPLNSPKRPPYWNSTYGFHFHTSHIILYQSAKFYPNRTTPGRKNDVMSIFKIADLSHLGLYGSNNSFFEKPS